MAAGRQDENWGQTASIMAMMLNVNRAKRSDRWFTAIDFPRVAPAAKTRASPPKADIGVLRAAFVKH